MPLKKNGNDSKENMKTTFSYNHTPVDVDIDLKTEIVTWRCLYYTKGVENELNGQFFIAFESLTLANLTNTLKTSIEVAIKRIDR